jgi:transmembrane sensor
MPRANEISDAAARWLIELEGRTRPDVWDRFQVWMDADPRHRAAFVRLRVAWNRADLLKSLRPANGTVDNDLLAPEQATRAAPRNSGTRLLQFVARAASRDERVPMRRRLLAAGGAIAAAGLLAWIGMHRSSWSSYETRIGSRQRIALADGTEVHLNTNTMLKVRITADRRDIVLARGEALFHVAADRSRPFYVSAGETVVRAVGTAFSVRIHDSGAADVMVEEGRVAVGAPGTDNDFENPLLLASAPKVSAGQIASVRRGSVSVQAMSAPEIDRKLSWTEGYLAFQGETLEYAVEEFNRYHRRRIVIADPAIRNKQVGGHFATWDQASFLAALQTSFGIRIERDTSGIDIRLLASGHPEPR